jgi:POT family proton-dependent oligopeptide transporter
MVYCLGCMIMTVSKLEEGWGVPGLLVSTVMIGVGAGGFRAAVVPFIADQQPWFEPALRTLKTGELVFIDHQLTLQYTHNLYYW